MLKMEAAGSSETLANVCQVILRHIPQGRNLHGLRRRTSNLICLNVSASRCVGMAADTGRRFNDLSQKFIGRRWCDEGRGYASNYLHCPLDDILMAPCRCVLKSCTNRHLSDAFLISFCSFASNLACKLLMSADITSAL